MLTAPVHNTLTIIAQPSGASCFMICLLSCSKDSACRIQASCIWRPLGQLPLLVHTLLPRRSETLTLDGARDDQRAEGRQRPEEMGRIGIGRPSVAVLQPNHGTLFSSRYMPKEAASEQAVTFGRRAKARKHARNGDKRSQ